MPALATLSLLPMLSKPRLIARLAVRFARFLVAAVHHTPMHQDDHAKVESLICASINSRAILEESREIG